MGKPELTEEQIAAASKIAALDQAVGETNEWENDAENMAAFYRILIEGGVPEPVANLMLLNAQTNYYEADSAWRLNGGAIDPDDDDD